MPGGRISARAVLACLCLGALVSTARGQALDKVTMGITGTSSDVASFIARKKGYFRAEGLDVDQDRKSTRLNSSHT